MEIPKPQAILGSTKLLLQLCLGYFLSYVVFGTATKYFQGATAKGLPGMSSPEWLVYSTAGSSVFALLVCVGLRWVRLRSTRSVQFGPLRFPIEYAAIVPSGICTAVVIPATTLLYSLPISVMVAMVIMRGSIIACSRLVDAIQIRQGILKRRVVAEENWGVVFALLAVCVTIFWTPEVTSALRGQAPAVAKPGASSFAFLRSPAAMIILGSYIVAYTLRLYIMNWFKNTRPVGEKLDNRGYFAVEQMAAFSVLVIVTAIILLSPGAAAHPTLVQFRGAFFTPHSNWRLATVVGTSFGIVAIFSVFLFLFQGRTATFAGLVNRLTSLVAGTVATLLFAFLWRGSPPKTEDWIALGFIFIAVGFLARAEKKRAT